MSMNTVYVREGLTLWVGAGWKREVVKLGAVGCRSEALGVRCCSFPLSMRLLSARTISHLVPDYQSTSSTINQQKQIWIWMLGTVRLLFWLFYLLYYMVICTTTLISAVCTTVLWVP